MFKIKFWNVLTFIAFFRDINKAKRSYTQLDVRKQVITFQDGVTSAHKGSSTPTEIICSYWPIVRSIRENIRRAVLKYGPNDVRFVRKTKVRIFSRMDRTNWSIRASLYSHNQRPEPSSNSKLNIFVIFLECRCWKVNSFQFLYLI